MDRRLRNAIDLVEENLMAFRPGASETSAIDTTVPLQKLAENGCGVPRVGQEAAAKMLHLSSTAGEDIRQLGDLVMKAAETVRYECYKMADDVESNGNSIATHLTGFAQLLAEVGIANRETRARLLRGETAPPKLESKPSDTPTAEEPHEQPQEATDPHL